MLDNDVAMAQHYNIESYYIELSGDLRRSFRESSVRAGVQAPRFEVTTIDGEKMSSESFAGTKDVAIIFGSYSAPPVQKEMKQMDEIYLGLDQDHAAMIFVYTREIHPMQEMAPRNLSLAHHRTMEQKIEHARMMRDELELSMPICVDDLMGTMHRAYGSLPFFQVVVDRNGTLIHRSEWANPGMLRAVMENVDQRKSPPPGGGVWQRAHTETIWGTGKVSVKDYRPGSL